MVVLFVTPYLRKKEENPKGGGLETYLFRVAGALKKMGHEPIILALGDENMHYRENDVEIFFTVRPSISIKRKFLKIISIRMSSSLVLNRKVKELIRKRKVDVVQFASLLGLAICYYGKTPAVMRLSSYAKTYYKDDKGLSRVELYIMSLFERLAARRCNAVFAPSHVIADAFSRDIHRTVSVVESPFWNDCVTCDESIYHNTLYGKKYLLFVGRLHFEKGILVIAEILEQFLAEHPDYYFVCCGESGMIDGRNSVRILQLASGKYKDRFIYMPPLSHEYLYPVIWHADFVICPSIMENFSNSCMEAMYFKRVVIGTDGTSFEQLIDDGKNGLLCVPGDAESLLNKMNVAAGMSGEQKEEMGQKARKRIDRLAPEYTVKTLLHYYRYVINNIQK
ncbi:MAG: glycosyltransferase family 4 protein [Lachnospiraceae bacterium]|nr:glycosyltransferase family 4 protein [Lachnospiraceae bacterium]